MRAVRRLSRLPRFRKVEIDPLVTPSLRKIFLLSSRREYFALFLFFFFFLNKFLPIFFQKSLDNCGRISINFYRVIFLNIFSLYYLYVIYGNARVLFLTLRDWNLYDSRRRRSENACCVRHEWMRTHCRIHSHDHAKVAVNLCFLCTRPFPLSSGISTCAGECIITERLYKLFTSQKKELQHHNLSHSHMRWLWYDMIFPPEYQNILIWIQ